MRIRKIIICILISVFLISFNDLSFASKKHKRSSKHKSHLKYKKHSKKERHKRLAKTKHKIRKSFFEAELPDYQKLIRLIADGQWNDVLIEYPQKISSLYNNKDKCRYYYWLGICGLHTNQPSVAEEYFSKAFLIYRHGYYSYKAYFELVKMKLYRKFNVDFRTLKAKDAKLVSYIKELTQTYSLSNVFSDTHITKIRKSPYFQPAILAKNLDQVYQLFSYLQNLSKVTDNRLSNHLILSKLCFDFNLHYDSLRIAKQIFKEFNKDVNVSCYYPNELGKFLYPTPHEDTIIGLAEKCRLDPYLIWSIIREESEFKVNNKSWAGATGLMQLMPQTAKLVAQGQKMYSFSLFNPSENIKLGTHYYNDLVEDFDSNILALASYNGGPNRIKGLFKRFLKESKTNNLELFVELIPIAETKDYVMKVLRSYYNYKEYYNGLKFDF